MLGHASASLVLLDPDRKAAGWHVHLGQVVARMTSGAEPDRDVAEFLGALVDPLCSLGTSREMFWLELFAAKMPGGGLNVDCRLRNEPWQDGAQALAQVAHGWHVPPDVMLSKRQFVLLEPADLSEVDPTGEKVASLEAQLPRPSLLKRLFGRR